MLQRVTKYLVGSGTSCVKQKRSEVTWTGCNPTVLKLQPSCHPESELIPVAFWDSSSQYDPPACPLALPKAPYLCPFLYRCPIFLTSPNTHISSLQHLVLLPEKIYPPTWGHHQRLRVQAFLFPGASLAAQTAKNLPANAGDPGSIPGLGRSPEGGRGSPLQHSCLENPMDRGAWRAAVHGAVKSDMTERLIRTHIPLLITWNALDQRRGGTSRV